MVSRLRNAAYLAQIHQSDDFEKILTRVRGGQGPSAAPLPGAPSDAQPGVPPLKFNASAVEDAGNDLEDSVEDTKSLLMPILTGDDIRVASYQGTWGEWTIGWDKESQSFLAFDAAGRLRAEFDDFGRQTRRVETDKVDSVIIDLPSPSASIHSWEQDAISAHFQKALAERLYVDLKNKIAEANAAVAHDADEESVEESVTGNYKPGT